MSSFFHLQMMNYLHRKNFIIITVQSLNYYLNMIHSKNHSNWRSFSNPYVSKYINGVDAKKSPIWIIFFVEVIFKWRLRVNGFNYEVLTVTIRYLQWKNEPILQGGMQVLSLFLRIICLCPPMEGLTCPFTTINEPLSSEYHNRNRSFSLSSSKDHIHKKSFNLKIV